MKKVHIITGGTDRVSSYEEKDTGIKYGTEMFEYKVAEFINNHEVIEIHYSTQYVDHMMEKTRYSVLIIYEEE